MAEVAASSAPTVTVSSTPGPSSGGVTIKNGAGKILSGVRAGTNRVLTGDPNQGGLKGIHPIAQVIIVAGVAYGIYKLATLPKKIQQGSGSRSEEGSVNQEYDKLASVATTKPSLTNSQMAQYANQLFQAMDGYGTTEETIISVMKKMKNDADLLGVIKAYGIRTVSSGRFNPEPDLKGTLAEALTSELSSWWIDALNKILKSKGIKYNFA